MSLLPYRRSEIPDLIAWGKFIFWSPYYSLLNLWLKWKTMPRIWSPKGKVCVITGCSAGLGEALAKLWASKGAHLVICARRLEPLETVAKECEVLGAASVTILKVDVCVEADCANLAKVAGEKFGRIDCLVLNAGISLGDTLENLPLSAIHAVTNTNKSTQPKIVPISSLGGLAGSPTRTGYSATKFALKGFYDALRNEYPGFLEVSIIYPGVVKTDLNRTRIGGKDLSWKGAMSAEAAVGLIDTAVRDGKLEEVFTDAGKTTALWLKRELKAQKARNTRKRANSCNIVAIEVLWLMRFHLKQMNVELCARVPSSVTKGQSSCRAPSPPPVISLTRTEANPELKIAKHPNPIGSLPDLPSPSLKITSVDGVKTVPKHPPSKYDDVAILEGEEGVVVWQMETQDKATCLCGCADPKNFTVDACLRQLKEYGMHVTLPAPPPGAVDARPIAENDVGHHSGSKTLNSHGYVQGTGTMKALLVGCIDDVGNMYNHLIKKYRCEDKNIWMLTDDLEDEKYRPTYANMISAFKWLIEGAQPGDSLFFHFSGHGGSLEDSNGDEVDGRDETIMPVDFETAGHIVDDEIYELLVRPLPRGVQLTVVFDSCHSGTAMDLPFSYAPRRFPHRSRFIRRITEINTFRNAIKSDLEKGLVEEKDLPDGLRLEDFDLSGDDVRRPPSRPTSAASTYSAASEADGDHYIEKKASVVGVSVAPLSSPSLEVENDLLRRGRKSLPDISAITSPARSFTGDQNSLTIGAYETTGSQLRSNSGAPPKRVKIRKFRPQPGDVAETVRTKLWPGCSTGASEGLVLQFASCRDFETAADAYIAGKGQFGAMTWAFVQDEILALNDGSLAPVEAKKRFQRLIRAAAGIGGGMKTGGSYRQLLLSSYSLSAGLEPDSDLNLEHELEKPFEELMLTLPIVDKKNYINIFSGEERCFYGGCLADFIHLSSGSSGVPTVWQRSVNDELTVASRFEQILSDGFGCYPGRNGKRTLCVIGLPMGSWVGGLFTTMCLRHLSLKGYPLSLLTPGNDPLEIIRCCERTASDFEQLVIVGYPPFIKTVIDLHNHRRGLGLSTLDLRNHKPKFIFAGEVFSESWREMVGERSGTEDITTDIVSIYGTADAGVLACETPLSVTIRRWLSQHPSLSRAMFGKSRLPSFFQYDACTRLMELTPPASQTRHLLPHASTAAYQSDSGLTAIRDEENRTLCFTTLPSTYGDPAKGEWSEGLIAPLIRYNIFDAGGVLSFDDVLAFCRSNGFDPLMHLPESHRRVRKMPFCFVFGRSMWTVSLYGANVFVENIMVGLETKEVKDGVTGKFVLLTSEDEKQDVVLKIIVELPPSRNPTPEFASIISTSVLENLVRINSEFAHYVPRDKQTILVELRPFGDKEWFPVGVKHKYTVG
ncbi:hypothetical protein HDU93_002256 [Gonapodya sp. JEL0774]|nr:hypothetical protein HDU93_002256 [Gonapodya sp. JEL0774]